MDAIDDVVDVDDDDTNVQHALHKTSRRYEFSFNSDKASFVSLQSIMNLNGLSKLDFGTEIDSLYMPIYDSGHCSLLILSIPRRTFLFLDSLSNERHRKIAELIRGMFVSAEMLFPTAYRVYELLTKTQAEDWECVGARCFSLGGGATQTKKLQFPRQNRFRFDTVRFQNLQRT